jgi:hypothetical protein
MLQCGKQINLLGHLKYQKRGAKPSILAVLRLTKTVVFGRQYADSSAKPTASAVRAGRRWQEGVKYPHITDACCDLDEPDLPADFFEGRRCGSALARLTAPKRPCSGRPDGDSTAFPVTQCKGAGGPKLSNGPLILENRSNRSGEGEEGGTQPQVPPTGPHGESETFSWSSNGARSTPTATTSTSIRARGRRL